MDHIILQLANEEATRRLGAQLATRLKGGMVVSLTGELGAGKTTLTRGILQAFGVTGAVKSPSYALVEEYALPDLNVYHFDFYRMRDPAEWDEAGFSEYFRDDALCVVEWAEKTGDRMPTPDLNVALALSPDGEGRIATLTVAQGQTCLAGFAFR